MFSVLVIALSISFTNAFLLDSFGGGPGGPGGALGGSFGGQTNCAPLSMFCPLQCPNGYAKDGHGCPICHCLSNTESSTMLPMGTYHHISNPCIPTHARCTLNCEQFTKGPGSCEYCQCDYSHTSTRKPTSTSTTTVPAPVMASTSVPTTTADDSCAIAAQICDQKCNGEYLSDHKDCTFCVCKSDLG